jgi:hypothetical protein
MDFPESAGTLIAVWTTGSFTVDCSGGAKTTYISEATDMYGDGFCNQDQWLAGIHQQRLSAFEIQRTPSNNFSHILDKWVSQCKRFTGGYLATKLYVLIRKT